MIGTGSGAEKIAGPGPGHHARGQLRIHWARLPRHKTLYRAPESLPMSIRPVLLSLAAGALSPSLVSQNITLLSNLDTRSAYAGVWGYMSPDGREFALVGERTGTWIVETT